MPTQPGSGGRVVPTVTKDPPKPKSDTLKSTPSSAERTRKGSNVYGPGEIVNTHQMLDACSSPDSPKEICDHNQVSFFFSSPGSRARIKLIEGTKTISDEDHDVNYYEPKPPKILMENPNTTPLELRSQIQMYAAMECVRSILTHRGAHSSSLSTDSSSIR